MIENRYEALSALIDGEVEDTAGLLKQVGADPELRARWQEHYRTRAAMHGEYTPALGSNFADRVSAALEKEPSILAPSVAKPISDAKPARWKRPALGFAIAASVAVVSVLGLNNLSPAPESAVGPVANTPTGNTSAELAGALLVSPTARVRRVSLDSDGTYWELQRVDQRRDPAVEKRLNIFMADHMEYAVSSKMHGMLPFSRLVGYDTAE